MTRIPTIPIEDVREFYAQNQPGGGWFSPDTLRSSRTRLPRVAYETNAGVLFITSRVSRSGVKRYTIHRQLYNGSIVTVGDPHHFPTHAAALAEIKRLHSQGG